MLLRVVGTGGSERERQCVSTDDFLWHVSRYRRCTWTDHVHIRQNQSFTHSTELVLPNVQMDWSCAHSTEPVLSNVCMNGSFTHSIEPIICTFDRTGSVECTNEPIFTLSTEPIICTFNRTSSVECVNDRFEFIHNSFCRMCKCLTLSNASWLVAYVRAVV